eukprot:6203144-Pleurochrysis_carterae.AAC.1
MGEGERERKRESGVGARSGTEAWQREETSVPEQRTSLDKHMCSVNELSAHAHLCGAFASALACVCLRLCVRQACCPRVHFSAHECSRACAGSLLSVRERLSAFARAREPVRVRSRVSTSVYLLVCACARARASLWPAAPC